MWRILLCRILFEWGKTDENREEYTFVCIHTDHKFECNSICTGEWREDRKSGQGNTGI